MGPVEVGKLENREVDPRVIEVARQLSGQPRLVGCGDADPSRLYFWPWGHERIIAGKLDPCVYNQRGNIWWVHDQLGGASNLSISKAA